jgi:cysteine-S-conjugate beta-lyase
MSQYPSFDDVTVAQLRAGGGLKWSRYPDAIGAFIAEMDFGTAPPVVAALHEAVDAGVFGYLPAAWETELAEAWCGWAAEHYGWAVPVDRVRPIADVMAGLQATIELFSAPGTPVILPTPAYMPFLIAPRELGREVIEVPLVLDGTRYVYDLDALDAAFTSGGQLMVLCNPHNPVGRVLEPDELRAICAVVERHGGRVFSDEIHAPLVYDGHRHVPYASLSETAAAHTVTAVSASKAWNLPGLKCAQLVLTDDADARTWAAAGLRFEHGAANLGVVAAVAAYTSGGPWLADVLAYLDGSRRVLGDLLHERIPEIGYTAPEGTYLSWLDCRALGLGDHPADFFLDRAGVALTDGLACGKAGAGFVRHNLATPRAILDQTVDQMAAALTRR